MRGFFLTAAAAGLLVAGAASAQTAPVTPQQVDVPLLQGMEFDDACGPKPEVVGRAICIRGPLASIATAAEAYISYYRGQGWQVVGGEANGVIFARRRVEAGCDGLEMAAFYDEARPVGPATAGWLAFAPIPGDVCPGAAAQ